MPHEPAPGSRLAALGHYLPDTVMTTEEVAQRLGIDASWVTTRTGIQQRRIADKDETVVDMAACAARRALADLSRRPEHGEAARCVDSVIVATSTAESAIPSVSARVAAGVGLHGVAAFDVNTACAGFCYSLALADGLIRSGTSGGVLVVGADKATAWLDWDDRDTAILFGDGAGAAIVLPHDRTGVGPVLWGSAGESADLIGIDPDERVLRQNGKAVYRWASGLGPVAREVCARSGISPGELAGFVPHQANLRIIGALARNLGLDGVPVADDVVDCGNTIAATIPIALSRMVLDRREIDAGGRVLLFGFGAGLAYAGQVVTLPPAPSAPALAAGTAAGEGCASGLVGETPGRTPCA